MEEELKKRNTDCVYFLASPLTCKKGSECEYRHSEIARLNPRDCWYWLSGSCLNPSCTFRHPPLDACTETSSESAHNQSAAPVNKTNVPCYYFYNGFCNKGERCSFLHGPVGNHSTWKSSNMALVSPDGPPVEKKASAGSDTGSAPGRTNSFQTGHQLAAVMKKDQDFEMHQPNHNVAKQNSSPLTPGSPYEDAVAGRSISPLPLAGSIQKRSHTSSPGFDVLVDNGSEELGYEDDYEYVLDQDREDRELNGNGYDHEENIDDNSAYPRDHGFDNHVGAELTCDYVREGPALRAHSRGNVLDRIKPHKRKLFPEEQASNGQCGMDLRELLKRRRMVDDHSRNHFSRRVESSHLISRSREMQLSRGQHRLHGRRALEFKNSFAGSRSEDEGRSRRSPFDRSRLQEKPCLLLSDVSGVAHSRKRSYAEESTVFTGPKTLSQIKDEKKRANESGELSERSSSSLDGTVQEDFRAPKTLSEILEGKRRWGSMVNGNKDDD